jgi:hypothetical protein
MSYVPATATSPATYDGKTAEQWRAEAKRDRERAQESWERSDTDGFLSQWALGVTANECLTKADLIDAGGMTDVDAVFTLDGEFASADLRDGQYGAYYLIDREIAAKLGMAKPFFTPSNARKAATRRANNAKKGFTFGTIRVRGQVEYVGNRISVRAVITPDPEALRNGDFEIVSTDDDHRDH